MPWQDDEDQPELHDEAPDESDQSDEPAEVPCPYCKREMSEEAERCPHCGCYILAHDAPRRLSWWWIVGVVLLVLLLLRYVLR